MNEELNKEKQELYSIKLITISANIFNPTEVQLVFLKIKYSTGIYNCCVLSGLESNDTRSNKKSEWLVDKSSMDCCCCIK